MVLVGEREAGEGQGVRPGDAELQVELLQVSGVLLQVLGRAWQGLLLLPSCSATSNGPLLPSLFLHLLIKLCRLLLNL